MDGVVKEVPDPKDEPPVKAAYQLIVPADAVAPSITVPDPQREPGVVPVIVGKVDTLIIIVLGVLEPQLLLADTEIVPPLLPTTTSIEFVEELPVQPDGKTQV